MPTYEYVCTQCGQHVEAVQSFSDPPLTTCEHCGGALRKVFGNIGIVLKGSGFYKNDSREQGGKKPAPASSAEPGGSASTAASSEGAGSSPAAPSSDAAGSGTGSGSGQGSSSGNGSSSAAPTKTSTSGSPTPASSGSG